MAARRKGELIKLNAEPVRLPLDADLWQEVAKELSLSPQQVRIVELVLQGRRDKDIAAELGLSVPTVRTYLKRAFDRVEVKDRIELILRVFALAQELNRCPTCRRQQRHQCR